MSLKHISLVTIVLASGACSTGARPGDPFQRSPTARGAVVAVQNHGDADVAVYVADAKYGRRRIGTVMRTGTGELVIPVSALSGWGAELIAVPVGGGAPSAPTCPWIQAGIRLVLVIERESVLSTCARNRGAP